MRVVLRLLPLLLLFASMTAAAGQAATPASASEKPDASQYVGTDTCRACHEDIAKHFDFTPHAATLKQKNAAPSHQGCEGCHGPGKAHVDGGGDVTKIIRFKDLSAEEASKRCQTCHGENHERGNFQRSPHLESGVGCTSCHDPHHAKTQRALLKDKSPQLCYSCHTEVRAEFDRPFRHRVNQGLVSCNDCHNPHGGFVPKQLRTTVAQDQVCYKCHRDKKGPFVFEHLPVKTEGCTSCHFPHGSSNPRLLRVYPVNLMCLQCHTQAMSSVPSQPPIGPAHNQNQKYQACTMCHAFIHGSNFSEVFFKP